MFQLSRPCKWAKAWLKQLSKGFEEYCLGCLLLGSLNVTFGVLSLNLLAEVSGGPIILKMLFVRYPDQKFVLHFSTNYPCFKFVFISIKGFYRRYCCLVDW